MSNNRTPEEQVTRWEHLRAIENIMGKITYYGNGQTNNNVSDGTEGTGAPTTFAAKATGVQVNVGESANTFVYFKTLERANADGTGNLKYTAIPNPFQVRPTYGTASVSSTRTVYISWSCNTWYYSQYAQVYFVYTNASGTVTTSSTYTTTRDTSIRVFMRVPDRSIQKT